MSTPIGFPVTRRFIVTPEENSLICAIGSLIIMHHAPCSCFMDTQSFHHPLLVTLIESRPVPDTRSYLSIELNLKAVFSVAFLSSLFQAHSTTA